MKSLFLNIFYALTGPKYAEKYEDSESGLKNIHFLAKQSKNTILGKMFLHFCNIFWGSLFWSIGGGLTVVRGIQVMKSLSCS